ncbi:hypothetical protein Cgig2_024901 [Carnegiea gigantea]|uniref:Uncharacterized protein n=1 Tax=Carnegiea gigantea TaxID=171969 RepID=A0A9Q1KDB4_9CARY|nr:hypothetical protein Cgig2_024901 [Carnegiea gigantea]
MGCSKSMDDFSFPIVTNPFSNLMIPPNSSSSSSSSSSLWRVSSRVYHHEEGGEGGGRMMEVRSMCEEGLSPMMMSNREINIECVSCQDEEWEVEERMDYLWEDFNHEEEKRESKRIGSKEICIVKKQGSNKMGRIIDSCIEPSSEISKNSHIENYFPIRKIRQKKASKLWIKVNYSMVIIYMV